MAKKTTKAAVLKPRNRVVSLASPNGANGKNKSAGPLFEVVAPMHLDIWNLFITQLNRRILLNEDYIIREQAGTKGIDIYNEMEDKDPHIFGAFQVRKSTVANLPWEVVPASKEARDVEIADFCTEVLQEIPKFKEDVFELLDGIAKGFSVSEVIWKVRQDGRIGIERLDSRRQRRFSFDMDGGLQLLTPDDMIGHPAPAAKFVVFRNGSVGENPYGEPVLRKCYWYYLVKKTAMKFWGVFLERWGQPGLHLTYDVSDGNTISDDEKKELDKMLATIQQSLAWKTSSKIKATVLEAQRSGQASYEAFLRYCDQQSSKAIVGQSVVTDMGESGSPTSPKISNQVRWDLALMDVATLEDTLNSQLIKFLVDFNFEVDKYPRFRLDAEEPEDLMVASQVMERLWKMGLPISQEFLHEKFRIPVPEEGAVILEPAPASPSPFLRADKDAWLAGPSARKHLARFGRNLERRKLAGPPDALGKYDLGSVTRVRRRFAEQLDTLFQSLNAGLRDALVTNQPAIALVEDYIADNMPRQLAAIVKEANLNALRLAAESLARKLNATVNETLFQEMLASYSKVHAYELGAAQEMTDTIRRIMGNRVDELMKSGKTIDQIRDDILSEFSSLSKSRAEMIAVTETQRAANWGAIQLAKSTGMDLDAWFVGESTDEPICLDLMAGNPYTVKEAEGILIPHPFCVHRWIFSLKGKPE